MPFVIFHYDKCVTVYMACLSSVFISFLSMKYTLANDSTVYIDRYIIYVQCVGRSPTSQMLCQE